MSVCVVRWLMHACLRTGTAGRSGLDVAALSDDSWLHWSEGEGSEWPTQNLSSLPVRLDGAREILIFHMLDCRVLRVFIVKDGRGDGFQG